MRSWTGITSRAKWATVCGTLLLASLSSLRAQEMMQVVQNMPGIKPETSYKDFGRGEATNLANGGLTVTHPSSVALPQNMGAVLQPVRVYNSKNPQWTWGEFSNETDLPYGMLGFGWTLSYGRIFVRPAPHAKYNVTPLSYETRAFYFYQDETGAEHRLYRDTTVENLGRNNPFPASNSWYFTCDGSYIRAKYTYASTGGTWVIYYPDGSTRAAGGTSGSSYIAASPSANIQNPDGTYYFDHLLNPHVSGWYVTQIQDRSSNSISISYRTYSPPSQPIGGSIQTITDQFSTRSISLSVDASTGLLTAISGGGMSESYSVTTTATTYFLYHGALTQLPTLQSVTDAANLQTLYRYDRDTSVSPGANDGHLIAIYYPTGAVSQYTYNAYTFTFCQWPKNPNYADCDSAEGDEIIKHVLNLRAPGSPGTWNALTWTYHRYNPDYYLGRSSQTQPIRVTDPLGGYVVHFLSFTDTPNSGEISPGKEVAVLRYGPGAACSYNPSSPDSNRIAMTHQYWDWGDRGGTGGPYGDVQRCLEDGATAPQVVAKGNGRIWKISEKEYPAAGGSTETWSRDTWYSGWDGFGHYLVSQTTGTNITGTWVTAANYNLKKDQSTTLYQLDRLTLSMSGTITSMGLVPRLLPGGDRESDPPMLSGSGEFKVVQNTYETPNRGLLVKRTDFAAKATSLEFNYSTQVMTSPPAIGSADRSMEVTSYTTQGNISQLKYYLGPSTSPTSVYYANFSWAYGMVSQMWWDSSIHYYELTRSILAASSRIDYQDDPNGFRTQFTYDTAGRVIKIEHKDSFGATVEYPEQAAYVSDSTSFGSVGPWTTLRQIKVYKGSQTGSMPTNSPGTGLVTLPLATDTLAWYTFDDLGRLVTTQNVMRAADAGGINPGAYWSQKETRYDALGRVVFSSEPFFRYEALSYSSSYGQTLQLWEESSCSTSSPNFALYVPTKNSVPLGTWDSTYGSAGLTAPFSGSIEPFYRTSRVVKPDGTTVDKSYTGLSETTTVRVGSSGSQATTTYSKNALGWLLSVSPPAGAAAAYSYDGLGNLTTVNLNSGGQTRTFTYDAMGRVTGFNQPELGTWSFTFDSIGNVIAYSDGGAKVFSNGYDWKGRLTGTTRTYPTPSFPLVSNTYDGPGGTPTAPSKGKLVKSIGYQADAGGSTQTTTLDFTYLSASGWLGTIGQTVSAYGASPPALSYTLGYDSMGQVTTQALPSSNTITNTYTAGFLASRGLSTPAQVSSLIYNPAGALLQLVFNNGMKELATYDTMSRPTGYRLERNSGALWTNGSYANSSYPYAYDGAGNIYSIGNMTPAGVPDTFTYDLASRLTGAAMHKSASTPAHTYAYEYDVYGNLVGRAESRQAAGDLYTYLTTTGGVTDTNMAIDYVKNLCFTTTITSGTSGVSNKLGTVTRGGTRTVGGTAYITGITQTASTIQYDGGSTGNGNVTDDGTYTYAYDPLNRQVAVRAKTAGTPLVSQYFYDAAGERSATIVYNAVGTATSYTQYLRDGSQVVYEKTWTLPGPTASSEKTYIAVQGKMAVTKQVVLGTTTYSYYGTDHLGTVRATATFDSLGTYQGCTLQDYEPYGMEIVPRDLLGINTHRYTGQERDLLSGNSGTYYSNDYMHYRSYESNAGRFMKPDNIMCSLSNSQSWNKYAYVNGNPVKFNDPTGHVWSNGAIGSSESQHPGAFPDWGICTWWLNEANDVADAIPSVIHVAVNVIVDPALNSQKAEQYAKKEVAYLNSAYWKFGIDFTIKSISTGTIGVNDTGKKVTGDVSLVNPRAINLHLTNNRNSAINHGQYAVSKTLVPYPLAVIDIGSAGFLDVNAEVHYMLGEWAGDRTAWYGSFADIGFNLLSSASLGMPFPLLPIGPFDYLLYAPIIRREARALTGDK